MTKIFIATMVSSYLNYNMDSNENKCVIGKSICKAIAITPYTDFELANLVGVEKGTVYVWRSQAKKGNLKKIKHFNLVRLAKALGMKLVAIDDKFEFQSKRELVPTVSRRKGTVEGIKENERLLLMADRLLQLLEDNNNLRQQLEELKEKK